MHHRSSMIDLTHFDFRTLAAINHNHFMCTKQTTITTISYVMIELITYFRSYISTVHKLRLPKWSRCHHHCCYNKQLLRLLGKTHIKDVSVDQIPLTL